MSVLWCPECREETTLTDRGVCPFCDAPLTRRRRGGRKPGFGLLTDEHLRALHVAHLQGRSINQLADQVYRRVGYASRSSCATAISAGWKRLDLQARDRIDAVRLACTRHGLAPKHGSRAGYGRYTRRVLHGVDDQPRCAAMVRGAQCQRPAKRGIAWCASHDPATDGERRERLARMRARSSKQSQRLLPVEPLTVWVRGLHDELGTWGAVAEKLGVHRSAAHRLGRGVGTAAGGTMVGERYVERVAGRAGVPVDAIYEAVEA